MSRTFLIILILLSAVNISGADNKEQKIQTLKEERNLINQGNELYNAKRFAEAEVAYRKALEANHNSEYALYNLATSLLRQSGTKDLNKGNNPLQEAQQILNDLVGNGKNNTIVEKASYNLGNIAFNNNNYQQSIEYYKNALRKNPSNDLARENLRLAQKKLEEQQNQQQNQDKNQQENQDKNQQQQEKEKQKDQQNQQDQQQNQQQEQKKEEQKNEPQQQNGISDNNAEKILKAMENEEAATRRRVEAQRKKVGQANRRQPLKPW